jgi:hypothetical protein
MKSKIILFLIVAAFVFWNAVPLAFAEDQPHMQAALKSLQQAKMQLEKATHDKGGHRVKALELINQAISEVKQGIAFDDTHPDKTKKK